MLMIMYIKTFKTDLSFFGNVLDYNFKHQSVR